MNNGEMTEAEKIANRLYEIYKLNPPVDIFEFIKRYADVEETDIPFEIDALCHQGQGKPHIILKQGKSLFRRRFTYAHELGHLIIPWHLGILPCNIDEENLQIDNDRYYILESEANYFAAEFLAPSSWVEDIIKQKRSENLTSIIKIVSDKAQISTQAAIFCVCKHVRDNYIILYYNKINKTIRKLATNCDQSAFIPKKDGTYDINWLDRSCIHKDVLSGSDYDLFWWRYENKLDCQYTNKLVSESKDLAELILNTSDKFKISYIVAFYNLIKLLPEGFVVIITDKYKNWRYCSPNTRIAAYGEEKLNEYCNDRGKLDLDGYILTWWRFDIIVKDTKEADDERNSNVILNEILDDIYDERDIKTIRCIINGIIGGCNSKSQKNDSETFSSVLKQRFIGRDNMVSVLNHKEFDNFIAKKAKEMIDRRRLSKDNKIKNTR